MEICKNKFLHVVGGGAARNLRPKKAKARIAISQQIFNIFTFNFKHGFFSQKYRL